MKKPRKRKSKILPQIKFKLILKMAWRNLWRHKRRSLITMFAMGIGLALCIPTYGLMDGMSKQMIDGITQIHIGDIQIHNPDYPEERKIDQTIPLSLQKQLNEIPGLVAATPRIYSGGMVSSDKKFEIYLKGVEKTKNIPIKIGNNLKISEKCSAIINETGSKKLKVKLGAILLLNPMPAEGACEKLTIVGITMDNSSKVNFLVEKKEVTNILGKKLTTSKIKKMNDSNDDDIDNLKKMNDSNDDDIDNLKKMNDSTKVDDIDNLKKMDDSTKVDDIDNLKKMNDSNSDINKTNKSDINKIEPGPSEGKYGVIRNSSNPVGIFLVAPKTEKLVTKTYNGVIKGKYLSSEFKNNSKDQIHTEILLGEKLAKNLMVKVGDIVGMDMMSIYRFPMDRMFKVVGIFKTGLGSMDRSLTYIHINNGFDKDLIGLSTKNNEPLVHEFAIKVKNKRKNGRVAVKIKDMLGKKYLVRTWQEIEPSMVMIVKSTEAMTGVLLAIIFIIAAFGTMNTMLMSVMERIREFGVLKSIGMQPINVGILIMTETFFMSMLAVIAGGIVGIGLDYYLLIYGLDLSPYLPNGFTYQGVILDPIWRASITTKGVLVPMILLCIVSIIIAIWPAVRAARIKPVEAFRQQQG
jgi:ABC-type lipoprotein release transport system permease subunit